MRYRGRKRGTDAPGEIARTALFASVIAMLLVSSVAVASVVRNIDISPKVGDILVFRQGSHLATDWQFTVATSVQPATTCVLKPDVMAVGGGSLVVEERLRSPRTYRVHWAGASTSNGGSDCGRSADIILPLPDLQLLSNAVGGPGVEHKAFAGL